jgi:hypothetical protein
LGAATAYMVGDTVMDSNLAYVCILAHTSSAAGAAGNEPGIGASFATYWVVAPERIWHDINLPFTTSAPMAQRLARIELERNRRQITMALPCKLTAYKVQCPDVIPYHARRALVGLNKTFEILESTFTMDEGQGKVPVIGVDLAVRETDSGSTTGPLPTRKAESVGERDRCSPTSAPWPHRPDSLWPVARRTCRPAPMARACRASRSPGRCPLILFVTSGGKIMIEYKVNGAGSWTPLKPVDGAKTEAYIDGLNDGVAYDVQVWAENSAGTKSAVASVTNHTVTGTASSGKASARTCWAILGFEINASAATLNIFQTVAGTPLVDEWEVGSAIGSFFSAAAEDASSPHEGARNVIVRLKQNVTVPNDSVTYEQRVTCSPKIPVTSGQILLVACWAKWDKDTNLPASVTGTQRLAIKFFDASGSLVSEVSQDTSAPNATYARRAKLVQVPATSAYCKIECVGRIVNASGAALSHIDWPLHGPSLR